eukprot:m.84937 g.84937  ORF g.84937 m.84937 type:complete len:151 (-) comp12990_c0_seq3:637-1089(-)
MKSKLKSAAQITQLLVKNGDKRKALGCQRFFKTAPGEYAEGDQFIGITMPILRSLLKETKSDISMKTAGKLVSSPLHEVRMYGLLWLVNAYKVSKPPHNTEQRREIYTLYCQNFESVNNWSVFLVICVFVLTNCLGILWTFQLLIYQGFT